MLNYSLEVFYSPTLFQIYTTTVLIIFVINTASLAFISYAIIFHGMILETYRWLLLISSFLSYVVDFILATGHIVPLLPALIAYFDGIIGRFLDAKLLVSIFISTMVTKVLSLMVVIMYRYSMTTTGRLLEFFQQPKNLWGTFLVHVFVGCLPMFALILDTEDVYTYIDKEAPALKEFPLGSNVVHLSIGIKVYIFGGLLALLLIGGCAITWFYIYQMNQEIKKMKSQVSENVRRLQRMMFISVLIEAIAFQLFIAWPLIIVSLMALLSIPYGSYFAYILFTAMSFQTTISAITQFYFIRPFREAAKKLFIKFRFLKSNSIATISVVPVQNARNLNN